MFKKGITITTVVATVFLVVLLITTTPQSTGPLGILGFFVLMYISALGVLTFLFRTLSLGRRRLSFSKNKKHNITEWSLKQSYYRASVVAVLPVMFIAMQSVGEVGVYQLLLAVFFVVVAWLYVANRTG